MNYGRSSGHIANIRLDTLEVWGGPGSHWGPTGGRLGLIGTDRGGLTRWEPLGVVRGP